MFFPVTSSSFNQTTTKPKTITPLNDPRSLHDFKQSDAIHFGGGGSKALTWYDFTKQEGERAFQAKRTSQLAKIGKRPSRGQLVRDINLLTDNKDPNMDDATLKHEFRKFLTETNPNADPRQIDIAVERAMAFPKTPFNTPSQTLGATSRNKSSSSLDTKSPATKAREKWSKKKYSNR